jgi:glycosyltransferase involved in cell wall biosynthesis
MDLGNFPSVLSMPPAPLVSVIIPAFNPAGMIEQALRSVQTQTINNFEVIVVDDGSTDDTAAITQRFCDGDSRFFLVEQPHGGLSAARNTAIARARGEFIAFLDADDVWLPEKLARQIELFREDPRTNLAFTNFYFWDGERDLRLMYQDDQPLPEGNAIRQLILSDVYGLPTVMVRHETLRAIGLFDPNLLYTSDWDLWLRIGEQGLWARGIREPMVRYRRWPGSCSMNKMLRSNLADEDVRTLEMNLARTRHEELRPFYGRSLARTRAARELARARLLVGNNPDAIPAAVWRAWRYEPRLKWLRWYLRLVWPKCLGGNKTARFVHGKILARW